MHVHRKYEKKYDYLVNLYAPTVENGHSVLCHPILNSHNSDSELFYFNNLFADWITRVFEKIVRNLYSFPLETVETHQNKLDLKVQSTRFIFYHFVTHSNHALSAITVVYTQLDFRF